MTLVKQMLSNKRTAPEGDPAISTRDGGLTVQASAARAATAQAVTVVQAVTVAKAGSGWCSP